MGSAASSDSAEQDAQIKAFMQKNLTHVRELLHAVTNDPCPVLYSSDTPDKEDFRRMLKVAGAEYDSKTASADDLVAAIKSLADIHGSFNSIALACHGPSSGSCEGFQWSISDKIVVTSADDLKEGTDAYKVLAALGNAVNEKGRVDLLSCELLKTDEGKAILAAIEVATKCNFAASSDLTGNPAAGGDWIMESDGVNVKDIYFTETDEFSGTFFSSRNRQEMLANQREMYRREIAANQYKMDMEYFRTIHGTIQELTREQLEEQRMSGLTAERESQEARETAEIERARIERIQKQPGMENWTPESAAREWKQTQQDTEAFERQMEWDARAAAAAAAAAAEEEEEDILRLIAKAESEKSEEEKLATPRVAAPAPAPARIPARALAPAKVPVPAPARAPARAPAPAVKAGSTYPMQAGELKKGGHVMIKDKPCRISGIAQSKSGKHGHAKSHIVAIDIYTSKKYEDLCPASHNVLIPFVKHEKYLCMTADPDTGKVKLEDMAGDIRHDLNLPSFGNNEHTTETRIAEDKNLTAELVAAVKKAAEFGLPGSEEWRRTAVTMVVCKACGEEKIVYGKLSSGDVIGPSLSL